MEITRFKLNNGLRVVFNKNENTSLVAINIIYDFGSKDEHPDRTGLAHLLEHMMFEGSANVPDFDYFVERAGGTNNAFTNQDYTSYYLILPKVNIETALWLEADRMASLSLDKERYENQKKVVIEEFKQTHLNEPYGDLYSLTLGLAYQKHPYKWPTIGKSVEEIENSTREDLIELYENYYTPSNAILSISGNFEQDEIRRLVEKYFGGINKKKHKKRNLPVEPEQTEKREKTVYKNVPYDAFYMSFHIGKRLSESFYVMDVVTDILSGGNSGRLYQKLVKENHIFEEVESFVSGHLDNGLVMIYGRPAEGVSVHQAQEYIWKELEFLKHNEVEDDELQKSLNNLEFELGYMKTDLLSRTRILALFELLGNAELINKEVEKYEKITKKMVLEYSNKIFDKNKVSILNYLSKKRQKDEK